MRPSPRNSNHAFLDHLREAQDQTFHEITVGRVQLAPAALDAETLSLVDSISVESNTVVERHANKVAGYADLRWRDLNLVVAYVIGRSAVRNSENPLGPNVYVRALLRAAEQCDLHKEAWEFLLTRFEKPLGEELARVAQQLLEHFANHGVDVRAVRRNLASSKAPSFGGGAPGGSGLRDAGGLDRLGRDARTRARAGGRRTVPRPSGVG